MCQGAPVTAMSLASLGPSLLPGGGGWTYLAIPDRWSGWEPALLSASAAEALPSALCSATCRVGFAPTGSRAGFPGELDVTQWGPGRPLTHGVAVMKRAACVRSPRRQGSVTQPQEASALSESSRRRRRLVPAGRARGQGSGTSNNVVIVLQRRPRRVAFRRPQFPCGT